MKTINLFFDFEFTSLSPDAQPISLGIVSDESLKRRITINDLSEESRKVLLRPGKKGEIYRPEYLEIIGTTKSEDFFIMEFPITKDAVERCGYINCKKGTLTASLKEKSKIFSHSSKSFYAEFSDFDINRCDDWVKENVVSKLMLLEFPSELGFSHKDTLKMMSGYGAVSDSRCEKNVSGYTDLIKKELKNWLKQFSDYQIQFVADCGSKDWEWLVQLLAEWEKGKEKSWQPENDRVDWSGWDFEGTITPYVGLPKLPENISPVPFDLNDLIAIKKGITPKEAFDLDRPGDFYPPNEDGSTYGWAGDKHNALFDAEMIKEIYSELK